MKKIFLLLIILISFITASAQQIIKGRVSDAFTNEPLTGCTIVAPASKSITITDNSGKFTLNYTGKTDSIIVSCTGYNAVKLPVTGAEMNITLSPSASTLNEVIVSANRERQLRTDAPAAIGIISKTAIEETKATQIDQLLNQSAGVYMVDLGNQQHAMAIRQPLGYNNYFLYMEDGIPIRAEGDFNHNALIEINDAATERIEIVKGPASSLYGSEAVGGAVNFITQAPSLGPTARIEGEFGGFGYHRGDFYVSNTYGKLGIYLGGYYASRNTNAGYYDNFHKLALNFGADYTFNPATKLIVTAADVNYYTDQKGGLDSAQFFSKSYVDNPESNQRFTYRKVDAFRARATLYHSWNDHSHTDFTLYYRNNSIGQNPFYDETTPVHGTSTGQINVDAFTSYGTIIQHEQKFNFLNAKWITGASEDISPENYNAKFILINVDPQGVYNSYQSTDSMLTKYHANLYNTALYTQFEFNPAKHLKVTAGARYDRLDYSFTNHLTPSAYTGPADTTNSFSHITPKIGLVYDFGKDRGIYANYSIGFAPPNITDLYSGYTVPDLKPSTFYNYEIGGWLGITDHGYAELSLYQLNGTNEIVSVIQPSGISLNENTGKTRHRGAELSLHYNPTHELFFTFGGTYAVHNYLDFTDGKNNVDGNLMADAPKYIINSRITYKPNYAKGLVLSVEWQGLGGYYTDPENEHRYNGFNTFNVRAQYKIRNFEVWANCLNVADKVCATIVTYGYGSNTYYPGMLRTGNVGVGYSFR
jgi:iron complex outermembrane receptor protein